LAALASFDVRLTPSKSEKEDIWSPGSDLEVGNDLEEVTGSSKLDSPRKVPSTVRALNICIIK
jgi:hypothetical protein